MVRFSRSHIRFGTFERLNSLDRKDLIHKLLDHAIAYYYPHLWGQPDQYPRFYAELVQRVAELVAQWMAVGFCHAVLNTDNMSITGESFDYGPYAFIPTYTPHFTAAYFDYSGRYSYSNQPSICRWNLEMLQRPLSATIPVSEMESALAQFSEYFSAAYIQRMLNKLGFEQVSDCEDLVESTLNFLLTSQVGYHQFFAELRQQFSPCWREDAAQVFPNPAFLESAEQAAALKPWRECYFRTLLNLPADEMPAIAQRLKTHNPAKALLRSEIEAVWEPIMAEDNWTPFYELLNQIRED
jgi:uncharacterized protein YdiU (UPF0061 family)